MAAQQIPEPASSKSQGQRRRQGCREMAIGFMGGANDFPG